MDTSPEYIQQCEKAKEIQQKKYCRVFNRETHKYEPLEFSYQEGDWFFDGGRVLVIGTTPYIPDIFDGQVSIEMVGFDEGDGYSVERIIWLPRQDQLQEIYLKSLPQDEQDSKNISIVILDDFQDWVLDESTLSYRARLSMEQLWLAFVMRGNNKVWNGNNWEEE